MSRNSGEAQKTLVLLKPDAVQRGLVGEILSRLEGKGLKFAAMKMMVVTEDVARRLYEAHVGKPFFDGLVEFITSGPIVAVTVEGYHAVEVVRRLMGATDPKNAAPGTIRGDLALSIGRNLIHGSDSEEGVKRETELFFSPSEILEYPGDGGRWITES